MKALLAIFSAGFVFALGLGLSGMTNADNVIGFLNLSGNWNPSLAFVMVGAIGVHFALLRPILKRESPVCDSIFRLPARKDIDARLLGGSALFGVGWGLGGFCPGPGIVSFVSGSPAALVFVAAMVVGMIAFHGVEKLIGKRRKDYVGNASKQSTAS